ncbi:hypothetical protein BOTBODRAFT_27067 [Botryobasidium botryosum FD-172 SS1]|uniref:Uncharacterized protein n=1 Tax=Botryobasidium botryosum (strain FD-172 SS1) TaxID=930990 RepID=A0A067N263_BOTB1|nr:hypothetical protein BOTBODRAFT_27067 [Botryobasidium botryosum FD-172 SS1]
MRTEHNLHSLPAFPVYALGFTSDTRLVLGGGGGTSKSGIKNKLRLYDVDEKKTDLKLVDEYELEKGEDAPMTLATTSQTGEFACGINSTREIVEKGDNQNCRVFSINEDKITPQRTAKTIGSASVEQYQRVTSFSRDQQLLAVGSTDNEISLLSYPDLAPVSKPFTIPAGELYDADFTESNLLVVGTEGLYLLGLPSSEKGKGKADTPLELIKTINRPQISGLADGTKLAFRAARFNPQTPTILYAIMNSTPPRTAGRQKKQDRLAYLCKWEFTAGTAENTPASWTLVKTKSISTKSITVFDVSQNGKLLAYGSSDCSINVLDAKTLAPFLAILSSHDFPPTALKFNPSSTLLVSASADSSVRVIAVPDPVQSGQVVGGKTSIVLILAAIIAVLLAFFIQSGRL